MIVRCLHCDDLVRAADRGVTNSEGGHEVEVCGDCGWRGASSPLACPECGGLRLRHDHEVLPAIQRRDGSRILLAAFLAGDIRP